MVVGGVDSVEGGVDFGLDAIEGVEDGLGSVKVLSGAGCIFKAEFDIGSRYKGVDVGVLGGWFVDFLG